MYSHKAEYDLKFDFEAAGVFCTMLNAEFIESFDGMAAITTT